jgi:hypothetical protein
VIWLWIAGAIWSAYMFLTTGFFGWALVLIGDLLMIAYKWRDRTPESAQHVQPDPRDVRESIPPRRDRSSWMLVAFFAVGAVVVIPPLIGMAGQYSGSGFPVLAALPLLLLGLTAFNGVLFYRNRTALNRSAAEREAGRLRLEREGQTYSKRGLLIALALSFILGFAMLAWIGAHQDEIAEDLEERQYR